MQAFNLAHSFRHICIAVYALSSGSSFIGLLAEFPADLVRFFGPRWLCHKVPWRGGGRGRWVANEVAGVLYCACYVHVVVEKLGSFEPSRWLQYGRMIRRAGRAVSRPYNGHVVRLASPRGRHLYYRPYSGLKKWLWK